MNFSVASLCERGPRSENEDSVGIIQSDTKFAVAVADGLGGMGGGKRASQLAISEFERWVRSDEVISPASLYGLALGIHEQIENEQKLGQFREMATTLSAGVFFDRQLFVVHCGDSRVAMSRGAGIVRLTKDHSEAQRLYEAGKLTKAEFQDYPRKNILESALGIKGQPKIELVEHELLAGDKFFFTSDGLHNTVLLRELRMLAKESSTPERLISQAKDLLMQREVDDNYSMVVVYAD